MFYFLLFTTRELPGLNTSLSIGIVEGELQGDANTVVNLFLKDCIEFYRTHMDESKKSKKDLLI